MGRHMGCHMGCHMTHMTSNDAFSPHLPSTSRGRGTSAIILRQSALMGAL